jgi:hypothetical protein
LRYRRRRRSSPNKRSFSAPGPPLRHHTLVGGQERFLSSPWRRAGSSCLHRRTHGQRGDSIHRDPAILNTPGWNAKCTNCNCCHRVRLSLGVSNLVSSRRFRCFANAQSASLTNLLPDKPYRGSGIVREHNIIRPSWAVSRTPPSRSTLSSSATRRTRSELPHAGHCRPGWRARAPRFIAADEQTPGVVGRQPARHLLARRRSCTPLPPWWSAGSTWETDRRPCP